MWHLIKNWKILLGGAIIFALLSSTVYLQQKRINDLKDDVDRQKENVVSLLEDNSNLELTSKELQKYIKDSESKFAKEIDSVTTAHNIKIKDLRKIIAAKTEVIIKDTVYLAPVDTVAKVDSLYHLRFQRENKCISVSAMAVTTDPSTKIMFEELSFKNEAYTMVYKKKKKWWQVFKKQEYVQKSVNSCGETTIKEIEILKQ